MNEKLKEDLEYVALQLGISIETLEENLTSNSFSNTLFNLYIETKNRKMGKFPIEIIIDADEFDWGELDGEYEDE